MNKEIAELTLITNEDLNSGISFQEAIKRFKEWCGSDITFVSWGPDDYYMLRNNLVMYEMDYSWLPNTFDAQLMFADIELDGDEQKRLNYALWYYNEKPDGLHNALADVLNTVLVMKHFDLEDCLSDEYFRCDNLDRPGSDDNKEN